MEAAKVTGGPLGMQVDEAKILIRVLGRNV